MDTIQPVATITQQIDFLSAAQAENEQAKARAFLSDMHNAEIAHLMESTPGNLRDFIWELLKISQMAEVLKNLKDDIRNEYAARMDAETLAKVALYLNTDDLADILGGLPDHNYLEVLSTLGEQDRERVKAALSYPDDVAGGLMDTDTVSVRPDVTIDVVLRYLRIREHIPPATDALFVVDEHNVLVGQITLQDLVTHQPELLVSEAMHTHIQPIPATMSVRDVANLFDKYDLISAPVVDEGAHLVGRITVDDVVDLIREEADQTLMNFAGLNEEDTFTPIKMTAKRRVLWLTINLGTAILAALVSDQFEDTLDKFALLAILMTIVPSMGGIAGSQTLTLVIRGMALGQVVHSNKNWLFYKELVVSILNGLLLAIMIAVVVILWKGHEQWRIGIVIAIAMMLNLLIAALSGVGVPLLLRRIGVDPAIAGGVILTTITDVVGLFVFLGLATLFI